MSADKIGYNETMQEAFGRLVAINAPSADDLKVLMYLEAAGKSAYDAMSRGTSSDAVRKIFDQNGREEVGHAARLKKVIKLVSGEDVVVPKDSDNPFCMKSDVVSPVTKESIDMIVGGEQAGGDFYDRWAANYTDAEIVRLLKQNGDEERRHGDRLRDAAKLL
jgi:rubrerythrin